MAALDGLSADTTLGPQPASSDTSVVSISLDPNVRDAAPIDASLKIDQLAAAQTLVSDRFASAGARVGQGTLTITLGTLAISAGSVVGFKPTSRPPINITIGSGNDNLTGLAAAINGSDAGVTASILNDGQGARLVLKGAMGAANGFTLTSSDAVDNPAGASLSALAFAPAATGTTALASSAADAQFTVDGVAITRPTNKVSDVLAGYTLTLNAASGGTASIVSTRDAGLTKAAVKDYVQAYNALIGILNANAAPGSSGSTNAAAGPLYGQSTIAILKTQLAALSSRIGGGTSLAAIGVSTGRDGTLTVDSAMLDAAAQADTGQIQRLFGGTPGADGSASGDTGINGAVKAMRDALIGSNGGFASYSARLATEAAAIGDATAALDVRMSNYGSTLRAQFAAMNVAVAQYKSVSSFLTQEINAWNHTSSNGTAVTA